MTVDRQHWTEHVNDVIRSRHYTWIPEGLGGESPEVAMTWIVTDVMHICRRTDTNFDDVMRLALEQFRREEREQANSDKESP